MSSQHDIPIESVAPIRAGEMLAGKYRVERVLGVGGMGVVVAATHLQLDQVVAIKFLLPQAMLNPEVVARFAREARAAVKITSEHVARVIDVGELPTGAPYMVMEYLNGSDLSQVLTERGALPIDEAVEYILQASEALAEAHAKGIVHRDLKPANLFLSKRADGSSIVKVLDFGISKGATDKSSVADMSLTKTSTMMGSPMYMSPEQMKSSRDVDWRTDIWALGVILYELIAGRPAFLGETVPELLAKIITEDPPPLRTFRGDAPAALEAVIQHCLVKNTALRVANISELATALAPFAKRGRVSAERVHRVMEASGIITGQYTGISLADLPSSSGPVPAPSLGGQIRGTSTPPPGASQANQPGAVGGNTAASWSPATGHGEAKRGGRAVVAASAVLVTLVFVGAGIGVFKVVSGRDSGAPSAGSAAAVTPQQGSQAPVMGQGAIAAPPVAGSAAGASANAAPTTPQAITAAPASASAAASAASAPPAAPIVAQPAPRRPSGENAAARPAAPAPPPSPHKNPLNIDIK